MDRNENIIKCIRKIENSKIEQISSEIQLEFSNCIFFV